MALVTPEYLQTKTYSALRDRLALQHGGPVQAGAWDANDFKITQRSTPNMSVDVAAGFALVAANDSGNAGLYHVQNDATVNVPQPTAAHASLPRIDSIYVQVNDTTHGGDASDTPVLAWATGTATSGATLDNRNGAASIPTGALLLADVLVPAAATTMTTANIRDRRTWARGARAYVNIGAYSIGGSGITGLAGTTNRIEVSGNYPVEGIISGITSSTVANGYSALYLYKDGVNWFFATVPMANANDQYPVTGIQLETNPAAGSHVYDFRSNVPRTSLNWAAGEMRYMVRELVGGAANANN